MNMKSLERATEINKEIKFLDTIIIHIEKVATVIANKEVNIHLQIRVDDVNARIEERQKVNIDRHGDLVNNEEPPQYVMQGIFGMMNPFQSQMKKPESKHLHLLEGDINATLALQFLAVLIGDKCLRRQQLLDELQGMGYEL